MTFSVTPRELTTTPISDILYGHFIELGYGIQVEPMWSEMFFNRSFEAFPPYKWINKEWYDLWIDPKDPSKGYKTDWSGEDWYHSGYEHNPWFAVPGNEGKLEVVDDSQFIAEQSPARNVRIERISNGAMHGDSCLKVVNGEAEDWGGFGQAGKVLSSGKSYRFRGFLHAAETIETVQVRLYADGGWDKPLFTILLGSVGVDWAEFTFDFDNADYEGRAIFTLWIPPGATLFADCFSLMPTEIRHGWRPDVVKAAARVNPKVIRWPGGCFASFYNWRDAIGPYDQRKPQPSYFWGGQNANDVGTAELATFANMLGAESMVCVNLYHPAKQLYEVQWDEENKGPHGFDFPHFTDIDQGARDAADWVAYCNLPIGAHPMADLRAEHGYPEPFGVKFWEMDNESLRWFKPKDYAEAVVVYSKAMKAVDPTIKIGLITYGDEYKANVREMLEIAGAYIDFLADRAWGETGMLKVVDVMRAYNADYGASIKYCDTEWLAHQDEPDAFNNIAYDTWTGETKSYRFSKWRYAMNIFRNFMMWQRQGGDVLFVNFNNFANTHSQCVIDTPKEGAFLTAAGRVFELLSCTPAAWPLVIEGYEINSRADFQVQAAWDSERKRLILYVFNLTDAEKTSAFDLSSLGRTFTQVEMSGLFASSLTAMNTFDCQDSIKRDDYLQTGLAICGDYKLQAPPWSITQIVLE